MKYLTLILIGIALILFWILISKPIDSRPNTVIMREILGNLNYEHVHHSTIPQNKTFIIERGKSVGEQLSCQAFENILGYKIKKSYRGNELKNPKTGRNLELDCYDPITNTAIEYNGIQHYEYPNVFHKSRHDFNTQISHDRYKNEVCCNLNRKLITIPYIVDTCEFKNGRYTPKKFTHQERYKKLYSYIQSHL